MWLNQETVHQRSLVVSSGTVDIHRTISNPSNASLDPPFTALSPSAWHHIFILHTSPHVQSPPITCNDTNQEKRHMHTVLFNHSSQGPSPTGISVYSSLIFSPSQQLSLPVHNHGFSPTTLPPPPPPCLPRHPCPRCPWRPCSALDHHL